MSTGIEDRERDFFGRHYEAGFTNPAGVQLRVERELRALQKRLGGRPIGRVLSIGCGDAPFECLLARHAEAVVGIDLSPDGIEKARQRAAAEGLGNLEFRCQTLSELSPDERFDGVVCIGLLHHVPEEDLDALLDRVHAQLNPGGFFFAREPSEHGVLRTVGRVVLGKRYDRYHSPDERELDATAVGDALRRVGFGGVETGWIDVSLIPGHYLFPRAPRALMQAFAVVDRVFCATPLARWASGFTIFGRRAGSAGAVEAASEAEVLLESRLARYMALDPVTGPYLEWQLDQIRPWLGQRVLEVGCGVGGILARLGPRERIVGVDIEPDILAAAAERFRDRPEYSLRVLDVSALSEAERAELEAERFDSIVCVNALEHMRDDIALLQTLEQLLVPGGTLAVLVPAHPSLYGPYDKIDGHWRRYSKAELRTLVGHTGMRLERLYYFNSAGAFGWWLQYRVLKRSVHGESQFGLMNALVPVLRPLEALVKPPFGLSLVAICRRPEV
ncbi:MAG: methyltransferase domain-containing protein [Myxococcota bacterium]